MINILNNIKKQFSFADILLFVSALLIGSFNEFAGCILSAILCVYIFLKLKKETRLCIRVNILSVSVAIICLMYGLSILWAIDRGMAFIGFLKFLPLILYLVAIWQSDKLNFETLLPYFSAVMVLISTVGMLIPFTSQFFSVAGRLAGFFQYPNSFALFLLVGEIVLLGKEKLKIYDFICLAVLIFGLLYTGSRTVFLIAIAANIVIIVYRIAKTFNRKTVFIYLAALVAVGAVTLLLIGIIAPEVLRRYLSISLSESTFVGRILYWKDAMPLLLKYPFGMGYLGYNFIQGTVQTGYYTVRYAHNDFLQIALDVGIIPAALFITAIAKTIFKKDFPLYKKIAILSICAHSFFDFDLQFLSVFFLLLLLLDHTTGKKIYIKKQRNVIYGISVVLLIINIYMTTHLTLAYFEQNKAADKIYPFNTDVKIAMLENEKDLAKANEICEQILAQNTATPVPYSVKSKYLYSIGDFNSLIEYKRAVFMRNPFKYYEYEEYCQMLINGISLYQKSGDTRSVEYCQKELINTKKILELNMSKLSKLGKKIDLQPTTQLPKEILYYITELEKR